MNHAIEQEIKDNTLYVEVEPQPAKPDIELTKKESGQFWAEWGGVEWEIIVPISIGDTVYQGEEWGEVVLNPEGDGKKVEFRRVAGFTWSEGTTRMMREGGDIKTPQTMPIELAHKTFKVVGIEVEEKAGIVWEGNKFMKKWFWKYSLEEL